MHFLWCTGLVVKDWVAHKMKIDIFLVTEEDCREFLARMTLHKRNILVRYVFLILCRVMPRNTISAMVVDSWLRKPHTILKLAYEINIEMVDTTYLMEYDFPMYDVTGRNWRISYTPYDKTITDIYSVMWDFGWPDFPNSMVPRLLNPALQPSRWEKKKSEFLPHLNAKRSLLPRTFGSPIHVDQPASMDDTALSVDPISLMPPSSSVSTSPVLSLAEDNNVQNYETHVRQNNDVLTFSSVSSESVTEDNTNIAIPSVKQSQYKLNIDDGIHDITTSQKTIATDSLITVSAVSSSEFRDLAAAECSIIEDNTAIAIPSVKQSQYQLNIEDGIHNITTSQKSIATDSTITASVTVNSLLEFRDLEAAECSTIEDNTNIAIPSVKQSQYQLNIDDGIHNITTSQKTIATDSLIAASATCNSSSKFRDVPAAECSTKKFLKSNSLTNNPITVNIIGTNANENVVEKSSSSASDQQAFIRACTKTVQPRLAHPVSVYCEEQQQLQSSCTPSSKVSTFEMDPISDED